MRPRTPGGVKKDGALTCETRGCGRSGVCEGFGETSPSP